MKLFVLEPPASRTLEAKIRRIAERLPELEGEPIRIRFEPDLKRYGVIHAGALVRQRRILFERALARNANELARIFVHELFHFAWVRLGNPQRWSYEDLAAEEIRQHVEGELGWSAQWRKEALSAADRTGRSRRWREYVCESYCDSAAWMFSGVPQHPEFTLARGPREGRRCWFERSSAAGTISV